MSMLFYLKSKDFLTWLKFPVSFALRFPKKIKKMVSRQLRQIPQVRDSLHLPAKSCFDFQGWCSANQFQDDWTEFQPATQFRHSIPSLSHSSNLWFFRDNSLVQIDSSGLAILHNAYVHGHHGGQFLNSAKQYLWDLGRENWQYFDSFFMDCVLRLPAPVQLSGTVAVLADEYAYNNFSHWVFDVLPKIKILIENNSLEHIDWFLVGHAYRSYQLTTLSRLGVPAHKIIQFSSSSFFQIENLLVPRLCGYNRQHHPFWKLDFLTKSFGGVRRIKAPWRKLFISRSDAAFRHLVDEDKLFNKLYIHGFEKIALAGLSLEDTVSLFAEAKVVIGPFGSGLMNIAFCQPETAVVEIVSPAFYNCYHWYLSGVRGLNHAVYFGDNGILNPAKPPNQLTKNITIDVNECYEFICSFL
jgi:hypothetical protein